MLHVYQACHVSIGRCELFGIVECLTDILWTIDCRFPNLRRLLDMLWRDDHEPLRCVVLDQGAKRRGITGKPMREGDQRVRLLRGVNRSIQKCMPIDIGR